MMNEDERRRYDRAWNDPPMYTMDQLNKQPTSAVPLNKRYKYQVADQQLLNNQMYQTPQTGYMQNAYAQPGYGQNQLYSQQAAYTQNQLGYNQAQMNAYTGQASGLQSAYGYSNQQQQQYPQQYAAAAAAAAGQQLTYGQQAQLPNRQVVSQQPIANQSTYQTTQASAYLPNAINPTSTINPSINPALNPALSTQSQIPVSNSMMQPNAYTMQSNQYGVNQYGQQQAMYSVAGQQQQQQQPQTGGQQYSAQNQYQY